jgi:flagellin
MRINQNIAAFNAYRNLSQTQSAQASSLEKLSSGFRINRAADDAAGLVNSENLRAQIGGLKVATRNAQDAISLVQTAEGAQTEVHSILQRMRDLTVQSGNTGTNDAEALKANQSEIGQLKEELNRIANQTQFGTKKILDGSFSVTPASGGVTTTTPASAAEATLGSVAASGLDFATTNLTFDIDVDGAGVQNITIDGDHGTDRATFLAELNSKVTGATFSIDDSDNLVVTSDGTPGVGTSVVISNTTAAGGSGVQDQTLVNGADSTSTTTPVVPASGGATFQVGANAGQTVTVGISSVTASALGTGATGLTSSWASVDDINFEDLGSGGYTNVEGAVSDALKILDNAISGVSENRATLGAFQNRMESTIRNVSVAVENLSAAESRVRDTDMAAEMVSFTRSQILSQAGTAMLAQANQVPQGVLSLLR